MPGPQLCVGYPAWTQDCVDWGRPYASDDDKMGVAIEMARQNVARGAGGPFGAAIFEQDGGRLVAVGMNLVVPKSCSVLHGEIVAFMMAQARLGHFSLRADGMPRHVLATSCEPCAMCLGATLWSGVCRVICGANREDAARLAFDEGPVFPESYAYLRERGIEFTFQVRRAEAAEVMEAYRKKSGVIYNA